MRQSDPIRLSSSDITILSDVFGNPIVEKAQRVTYAVGISLDSFERSFVNYKQPNTWPESLKDYRGSLPGRIRWLQEEVTQAIEVLRKDVHEVDAIREAYLRIS